MEKWMIEQRKVVAEELANKLIAGGARVHDVEDDSVISAESITYWAGVSFEYNRELEGEDPFFSFSDLLNIENLAAEIAVILNKKKNGPLRGFFMYDSMEDALIQYIKQMTTQQLAQVVSKVFEIHCEVARPSEGDFVVYDLDDCLFLKEYIESGI